MSARLRRLHPDEFAGWRAESAERYAADMVENGGFAPTAARAKAELDFERTLPDGLETPAQHVWVIESEDGAPVGTVWLGERDAPGEGRTAFVYEIRVDDACRGRGYGRVAMLLLEDEARELGHDRIDLNVFGGNVVARRLYRSLGYEERAVFMGKRLT